MHLQMMRMFHRNAMSDREYLIVKENWSKHFFLDLVLKLVY